MTADDLRSSDNDLMVTMRAALQDLIDKRSIRDRDTLLSQLVTAAVALVPTAAGGGISRTEERDVRSSHATDPAVRRLDQLQSELGEGPCVEAADEPPENGVLLARDLGGEDACRWPRFAPCAVDAGFRSILSASMTGSTGGRRAALNLYAAEPDAFDEHAVVTAGVFAGHAGALLYGADHAQLLGAALDSRDTIGQAKGILMERFVLDSDEAFALLVTSSQDTNMKLADVARWVVTEAAERRAERE
ncbi:GAF and ANTAR domain-containing protein [Actinomycetospora straminea]|uniref:GAF and ANTAR domain-containing protein n=1 Tax=Actinomycetospora straminea TaxID=663607 RepID=A0ABP9EZJ5_9PSEU|nr:GAF and ANTAR domain-containing protein [Actinomycetospora straminea]MDD7935722.1 GAF and ANTAR domain-containing protein [Actinomycetospora straminea]